MPPPAPGGSELEIIMYGDDTPLALALQRATLTPNRRKWALLLGVPYNTLRAWLRSWPGGWRPRNQDGAPSSVLARVLARDLPVDVRAALEDRGAA